MSLPRMLPFLLLNIILSAIVGIAILAVWNSRYEDNTVGRIDPPPLPTQYINQSPTPAIAPIVLPTRYLRTYEVVPGDTLAQIAADNGLSMSELIEINQIIDPDQLQIGDVLIVEQPPTPMPIPETPIATVAIELSESGLSLGNLVSGDATVERLDIVNDGANPTSLDGWTISDSDGNLYRFENVILFGNGVFLTLHTGVGTTNTPNFYWNLTTPVWQTGDTATLYDANGIIRAQYIIP